MTVSDEIAIALRPFAAYARIVRSDPVERDEPGVASRVLLSSIVLGGLLALTTAGRFAVEHVIFPPFAWAFAPAIQAATVLVTRRATGGTMGPSRAIALHMAGNGPWLVLLLLVGAVVVFVPGAQSALRLSLFSGVLPAAVLATAAWSSVTSLAFYRALGASWKRATILLLLEWLLKGSLYVAYFQLIDNLVPQFLGARDA